MKSQHYTLVILSERNGLKEINFTVTYLLKRFLLICSISLSVSSLFVYSAYSIRIKSAKVRTLMQEKNNIIQEIQNNTLKDFQKNSASVSSEIISKQHIEEYALKGIGGDESYIFPGYLSNADFTEFTPSLRKSQIEDNNFNNLIRLLLDLAKLQSHLTNRQQRMDHTPSIIPVSGQIVSDYGYRISPFTGRNSLHRGIDLTCKMNTPVIAPAAGIVSDISTNDLWGLNITIDHGNGIKTQYGHLESVNVKMGEKVVRRTVIAESGKSGRATGPHLHYQIWVDNEPVDPKIFVLKNMDKG